MSNYKVYHVDGLSIIEAASLFDARLKALFMFRGVYCVEAMRRR